MGDHLLGQILAVLLSVFAAAVGGIAINRRLSSTARANAVDSAESKVIGSAVDDMREDRDNWRKTAEEAWDETGKARQRAFDAQMEVIRITADARHAENNRKLQLRILRQQYPHLDLSWLDSGPMPLGPAEVRRLAPAETPPTPLTIKPEQDGID